MEEEEMKDMIERAEVVAYLRKLAGHAERGMSEGFRKRHPDMRSQAHMLLAAGLYAAANQIEEGKIDQKRWS
jgi:hypothetical protein